MNERRRLLRGVMLGAWAAAALYPLVVVSAPDRLAVAQAGFDNAMRGGRLTRHRILTPEEYAAAPRIVANANASLVMAEGDEVYGQGVWADGATLFSLYRAGELFKGDGDRGEGSSPEAGRGKPIIALEAEYLGLARVSAEPGDDLRRLTIVSTTREVRPGDRLLAPDPWQADAAMRLSTPTFPVEGRVVALSDGRTLASRFDTVVLNLGRQQGIVAGNLLSVTDMPGAAMVAEDGTVLPAREIGSLVVYRIFEELSYALLLDAPEPVRRNARASNH